MVILEVESEESLLFDHRPLLMLCLQIKPWHDTFFLQYLVNAYVNVARSLDTSASLEKTKPQSVEVAKYTC